ncbi:MAG: FAD-dependent oxidoreductase [Coriobacteriaceae bacterium]|nr:FAD-dependent oxidoreductase [Coriobacteriaceae bacterium]
MQEDMKKGIDRRSFLKGALATGAVATTAMMTGCSPSGSGGQSSTGDGAGGSAASGGKHTWEVAPKPITDIAETKDYDIVIVGCGLAGLSAAEAAARNGAKVAVLERADGFQVRGVDVGHIGSQYHLRTGFDVDPRLPAMMLHQWANQTTNYNLIYTWASRSGKVFDYIEGMVDKYGVWMVPALSATAKSTWYDLPMKWRVHPDAVSFVKGDEDGMARPDGNLSTYTLGECLYDSSLQNGAEYFFMTKGEQLVGNAASGISGVIALAEDGGYVQFNASKGVILCTGDIAGNQEMIDAFAPICNRSDSFIYTPPGGNTGDAITMGCWAGAAISKSPAAPMVHQFTLDTITFNLSSFIMSWLAVNQNGQRYGAEIPFEPYLTNARMNTPGSIAWSICDSDYPTYMKTQWPDKHEVWLDGLQEEMDRQAGVGGLFKADTLEELAGMIGVPADTFVATVERYGSMFDKGEDTDFDVPARFLSKIQTPPFYAMPLYCSTLAVCFGLHVNDDSQVCTEDDEPIEGLFAIGNAQGDFFGNDYPVHFPGISQGRCVTFGQLVGEALAKDTVITKTA